MQDQTLRHSKTAEVLHSVWKNKIKEQALTEHYFYIPGIFDFFCLFVFKRLNEELGVQPRKSAAAACHQI